MKSVYVRLIYFVSVGILILVLFFLFVKKENRKKRFSTFPEFSYTEVDGYKNSTKNLPQLNGYAVILFNPGCEACQAEAQDISDNQDLLENCCLLFLSPDSLHRIERFIKRYQLNENENVLDRKSVV